MAPKIPPPPDGVTPPAETPLNELLAVGVAPNGPTTDVIQEEQMPSWFKNVVLSFVGAVFVLMAILAYTNNLGFLDPVIGGVFEGIGNMAFAFAIDGAGNVYAVPLGGAVVLAFVAGFLIPIVFRPKAKKDSEKTSSDSLVAS